MASRISQDRSLVDAIDAPTSSEDPWAITRASWARLTAAWRAYRNAVHRSRALGHLKRALDYDVQTVMEAAFAGAAAAGFTLTKDGREYGVYVGDERIVAASEPKLRDEPIASESSRDDQILNPNQAEAS